MKLRLKSLVCHGAFNQTYEEYLEDKPIKVHAEDVAKAYDNIDDYLEKNAKKVDELIDGSLLEMGVWAPPDKTRTYKYDSCLIQNRSGLHGFAGQGGVYHYFGVIGEAKKVGEVFEFFVNFVPKSIQSDYNKVADVEKEINANNYEACSVKLLPLAKYPSIEKINKKRLNEALR